MLFKSFTAGLTVQEFDNIYNKEIAKRYVKHENKRLSCKRKENRKRKTGAIGRHFKLQLKDKFLMPLVYYRLYITYTLSGFLFNLDQKTTFVETFKRLNIEYGKTMCTNSTKDIPNNKETQNSIEEVEKYFPGFLAFTDCTEQQIPRPVDKSRRKIFYSLGKKKRHLLRIRLRLTIVVTSFTKYAIRKEENMTIYSIYKKNHPVIPKQVVNVIDLGYLGIETDFRNNYPHYRIKEKKQIFIR